MRARVLLAVGLLACGLPLPTAPSADELSSADRLRILYSHQFAFTDEGLPLVAVALMEGQTQVRLAEATGGGVRVLPDGEGGPELDAGPAWVVRVERSTPAVVRYWVVADRRPSSTSPDFTSALATWKERGIQARTFDEGTMFGVGGTVLDARRTVLAVGPRPTEAAAQAEARSYAKEYGLGSAEVYPELVQPPSGTLVVTPDPVAGGEGGVALRVPGVVWFAPASGHLLTVRGVEHGGGGSSLRAPAHDDRTYYGTIYVVLDQHGTLAVVNQVPADKLLGGLLPDEIGAAAPPAALEAQAVAARGELLAKIGTRHLADPYELCSSQHCQVYGGAGTDDPRADAAVAATRGEVLVRADGAGLVDTVYSADCGGASEDSDLVWDTPKDPVLRGALDAPSPPPADLAPFTAPHALSTDTAVRAFLALPRGITYCGGSHASRSSYRWTVTRVAANLGASLGIGRAVAVRALERGASGRIIDLQVTGTAGTRTLHGELVIRRALGGLRSSLFVVDAVGPAAAPTAFTFTGGGFGHGVGMCQDGAIGMAERGLDYHTILGHYYPHSSLQRVY